MFFSSWKARERVVVFSDYLIAKIEPMVTKPRQKMEKTAPKKSAVYWLQYKVIYWYCEIGPIELYVFLRGFVVIIGGYNPEIRETYEYITSGKH